MANQIILKKSSVAAKVPLTTDLEYGELALNYTDGKLYYKKSDNTIAAISEGSGSGTTLKTINSISLLGSGNIAVGDVTLTDTQTLTNKTISGANNTITDVSLTTGVSGTLPITSGGTGATSAADALASLGAYPATNPSGFTSNTGTVTSVSGTGTVSGLTLTGTVTGSGSLTLGGSLTLTSANVTTALGFTPGTGDVTLAGTQTLTNKTLTSPVINTGTASGLILNDGYMEEVYTIPSGLWGDLSPANGSIQILNLNFESNISVYFSSSFGSGQSITLMIDDGSFNGSINWGTVVWKTDGGSAPTLNATGYTVVALWKVGSTIYGARVGDA